jgi:hypothetical protein
MSETDKTDGPRSWSTGAMSPARRRQHSDLLVLANVGPAVARHLGKAGVTRVDQLAGRDPVEVYEEICETDGRRHDPCLLDAVMSAVDQAGGAPGRPWWHYTAERKRLLASR